MLQIQIYWTYIMFCIRVNKLSGTVLVVEWCDNEGLQFVGGGNRFL